MWCVGSEFVGFHLKSQMLDDFDRVIFCPFQLDLAFNRNVFVFPNHATTDCNLIL